MGEPAADRSDAPLRLRIPELAPRVEGPAWDRALHLSQAGEVRKPDDLMDEVRKTDAKNREVLDLLSQPLRRKADKPA